MKKAVSIFLIAVCMVCFTSTFTFPQAKADKIIGEWSGFVQDTGAFEQNSITIAIKKENGLYKGEAYVSGMLVSFDKITVNGSDVKIEYSSETPDGTMKGICTTKLENGEMKGEYEWEYGATGVIEIKKVVKTDITGTWEGDAYLDGQDAPNTMTIVIKKTGNVYSGTITDSYGYINAAELKDIKLDKNKLTFTYVGTSPNGSVVMENIMTIKSNEMTGTFKTTDGTFSGTYKMKKK